MSSSFYSNLVWKSGFSNWNCIKVTNIYDVVRPFYYVAKVYGFVPFQLNDQQLSLERSVTNARDWITILLSLCGYLYILGILCLHKDEKVQDFNENIIITIFKGLLYVITNFMSVISVIINILFPKNLLKIAIALHQIDNEVRFIDFVRN